MNYLQCITLDYLSNNFNTSGLEMKIIELFKISLGVSIRTIVLFI